MKFYGSLVASVCSNENYNYALLKSFAIISQYAHNYRRLSISVNPTYQCSRLFSHMCPLSLILESALMLAKSISGIVWIFYMCTRSIVIANCTIPRGIPLFLKSLSCSLLLTSPMRRVELPTRCTRRTFGRLVSYGSRGLFFLKIPARRMTK